MGSTTGKTEMAQNNGIEIDSSISQEAFLDFWHLVVSQRKIYTLEDFKSRFFIMLLYNKMPKRKGEDYKISAIEYYLD